ncbi:MAG: cob(I)yrinic acid a,c-diamide adenosyltransferase [Chloroflexia bacterium]|nr:cob(I)yrinic acid a,c-diamide adenosyltransferase [Chloroflexia bacterium]
MSPQHKPKTTGLVQIYTGDGKGKTTAALGLVLRAAGHGLRCYVGQFMKGTPYGELDSLPRLAPDVTIEQYGRPNLIHEISPEDMRLAQEGLERARQVLHGGDYDLVVLDEICVALHFELLQLEQVLELVEGKPPAVELILTGRRAPAALIERADLVTEMREVKHPYQQGIMAREGIEY